MFYIPHCNRSIRVLLPTAGWGGLEGRVLPSNYFNKANKTKEPQPLVEITAIALAWGSARGRV